MGPHADLLLPVQLGAGCRLGIPFGTDDAKPSHRFPQEIPRPTTYTLCADTSNLAEGNLLHCERRGAVESAFRRPPSALLGYFKVSEVVLLI